MSSVVMQLWRAAALLRITTLRISCVASKLAGDVRLIVLSVADHTPEAVAWRQTPVELRFLAVWFTNWPSARMPESVVIAPLPTLTTRITTRSRRLLINRHPAAETHLD
jgi:hypothetical protein